MALQLSKVGINTSSSILAWHVTQSVDALTGIEAYDLTLSGSLNLTGSVVSGSISNAITASHAITASYALNGGGGSSVGTLQQVMQSGSSTTISITGSNISASGDILTNTLRIESPAGSTAAVRFRDFGGTSRHAMYVAGTLDIEAIQNSLVIGNSNLSGVYFPTPITASGAISASGIVYMSTASVGGGSFTSASLAAGGGTTVIGNPGGTGANLTTINIGGTVYEVSGSSGGSSFPYTGSAIISGSLKTIGVEASHLDGQFDLTSSITVTAAAKTANNRYSGGSPNAYYLNGIESPYINFYPGKSYIFNWSGASSHPVAFYLDAAQTTQYTTGVSTPASNQTQISVTEDTPSILYYMCTAHSYMGNASHLQGGGNDYNNIQTHISNFTSSATYNGKYNVVGGNLTIAVDTSSADLTTGMEWDFFQSSSGDTFEFVPKTGVTLISKNNHKKLAAQGSAASLKYISEQTFHLVGDLTL